MSTPSRSGAKNVLGQPLITCSESPMTGFYRNGCCDTGAGDMGVHTVCIEATAEFLEFSKAQGNDLSTPIPQYEFPGLTPGDRWCLCAVRWKEAYEAGNAPKVILEATHMATLEFISLEELQEYATSAN
ncbi:MAG TPA: DUF2237 domain-containing protein [Planctomycetaceae bacterium]|nr:DUF2237 domain-containing protein [Planctomycetaceae bacterium]|tara:strand:+ start:76 stop:462 length:387 start_codon:yes stop_codon:yes gene_type:complete